MRQIDTGRNAGMHGNTKILIQLPSGGSLLTNSHLTNLLQCGEEGRKKHTVMWGDGGSRNRHCCDKCLMLNCEQ